MSKKINVQTKLKKDGPTEKLNLKNKQQVTHPKSYRWRAKDLEMLETLIFKVNKVSGRKLDATKVLRGAIFSANKKQVEKFLVDIAEAEMASICNY